VETRPARLRVAGKHVAVGPRERKKTGRETGQGGSTADQWGRVGGALGLPRRERIQVRGRIPLVSLRIQYVTPLIATLCWVVGGSLILLRVTDVFGLPTVGVGYTALSYYSLGFASGGVFSAGVVSVGVLSIGVVSFGVVALGVISVGPFSIGVFPLGIYLGIRASRRRKERGPPANPDPPLSK